MLQEYFLVDHLQTMAMSVSTEHGGTVPAGAVSACPLLSFSFPGIAVGFWGTAPPLSPHLSCLLSIAPTSVLFLIDGGTLSQHHVLQDG